MPKCYFCKMFCEYIIWLNLTIKRFGYYQVRVQGELWAPHPLESSGIKVPKDVPIFVYFKHENFWSTWSEYIDHVKFAKKFQKSVFLYVFFFLKLLWFYDNCISNALLNFSFFSYYLPLITSMKESPLIILFI